MLPTLACVFVRDRAEEDDSCSDGLGSEGAATGARGIIAAVMSGNDSCIAAAAAAAAAS